MTQFLATKFDDLADRTIWHNVEQPRWGNFLHVYPEAMLSTRQIDSKLQVPSKETT